MFVHLKNLQYVDLSNNGLTKLSKHFFSQNEHLTTVVLAKNKLENFYQTKVRPYSFISLQENNIESLNGKTRKRLDEVYEGSSNRSFRLDLRKNQIKCDCETLGFVKWVITSPFVIKETPIKCLWDGDYTEISENNLAHYQLVCKLRSYAWVLVLLGVVLLSDLFLPRGCCRFHFVATDVNVEDLKIVSKQC